MYITLKSIKRNLGLFNLEIPDLIIGGSFILLTVILFLMKCYTFGIVIISIGALCLVPIDFSKCNRMYRLIILFIKYLFKTKNYYYFKMN